MGELEICYTSGGTSGRAGSVRFHNLIHDKCDVKLPEKLRDQFNTSKNFRTEIKTWFKDYCLFKAYISLSTTFGSYRSYHEYGYHIYFESEIDAMMFRRNWC